MHGEEIRPLLWLYLQQNGNQEPAKILDVNDKINDTNMKDNYYV